jgi:hypothetical protein
VEPVTLAPHRFLALWDSRRASRSSASCMAWSASMSRSSCRALSRLSQTEQRQPSVASA